MTSLIKVSNNVVLIHFHNGKGKGKVLYTFFHLMPRVFLANAPAYAMSLTHVERMCAMGYGFKGKLVRLLSQGIGLYFEPEYNCKACHFMMHSITHRVASTLMTGVRDKAAKEAEELCASGLCAAAAVTLKLAVYLGHLPSRALMANMMIDGREGVAENRNGAFKLVDEGARLGCHHCQGVMAECYWHGYGCEKDRALSLELARESSESGSRYGQCMLGWLYWHGSGGLAQDFTQALALYRLAAAQNIDEAQLSLGYINYDGVGRVVQDHVEALRWFKLAAAQGHPKAMYWVAYCYENSKGIDIDMAKAITWYKRAQAAGDLRAKWKLLDFQSSKTQCRLNKIDT